MTQIDYLVVTHFHGDHMGDTAQLADRLPVLHFVDHGTTIQKEPRNIEAFEAYAHVRGTGRHIEVGPGDPVPVDGLDVRVIASGGRVFHHGAYTSGSEALVHTVRARAAVMNNGPRKGGAVSTFQILGASPGLGDLWQNHYSVEGGSDHNRPEQFIANLDEGEPIPGRASTDPVHMGPAFWTKISATRDGSFTITNSRNGYSRWYPR